MRKTILIIRLAVVVLSIGLVNVARADIYKEGAAAEQAGNFPAAVAAYRQGAEQDDALSQMALGQMYYAGQGVPKNYKQAVYWYLQAAEQGYDLAQYLLGGMYYNGEGVPQDYVQAYKWWNLSAMDGGIGAVKNRELVASKMAPAQIAEAQKLAREWKPKKK